MPDVTQSPLFQGSQFLRLALRGVVLAYVAVVLFVVALEFQAAIPMASLTSFGVALFAGFVVLEAAVVVTVFHIFKSISS